MNSLGVGIDWTRFVSGIESSGSAVVGAVIAFCGVLIGLIVTGFRARMESRMVREDEYRKDQRLEVAALLASAKTYSRQGRVISRPEAWAFQGYELASSLRESAEAAMADFQLRLGAARLIVSPGGLSAEMDRLAECDEAVAEVIHEAVGAFWAKRAAASFVSEREARWRAFDDCVERMQKAAAQELRPTIRDGWRLTSPAGRTPTRPK